MAAIAPPRIQAEVDGRRIILHPNMNEHAYQEALGADGARRLDLVHKPRTMFERFCALFDTANVGPFRSGQIGQRVFGLLNVVHPRPEFAAISNMFLKGWTATIFPRLPGATKDAIKAIKGMGDAKPDAEATRRKYVKVVNDVTDGVSAWGYAASMVLGCIKRTAALSLSVLKVADMVTFVHDVADLQINAEDFNKARVAAIKAQQLVGGEDLREVQNNLVETQRFHFLKTMKAVCSVAGFILGLVIASSGLVLLGLAIAAASLSLFSTLFAFSASVQEESMKYERVKFFDQRHVQRLAAAVA